MHGESSLSDLPYDWLHRDAFELVGITDNLAHPSLKMLTTQRRMHERICDLINGLFYEGKLRTNVPPKKLGPAQLHPLPGVPAVLVSPDINDGSKVEQTPNGSRVNRESARLVVKIAAHYAAVNTDLQIGVITPYRGQVSLIKRLLRDEHLPKSMEGRIKAGTVHAFQGSEADVVIWDLVESAHLPIGRLYHEDVGNRLTNVAISRAQGKLLIIGDANVFVTNSGANKVKKIKGILVNKFSDRLGNVVSAHELGF